MSKINVTEFLESLKEMTVLELNDLVKAIEEEFGVTAAAPVAVVAGEAAAVEEGPSAYTVMLAEIGPNKINVIKAVREIHQGGKNHKDIPFHICEYNKNFVNREIFLTFATHFART